jgi:hypothetical protein
MSGTSCAIANVRALGIGLAVCFHSVLAYLGSALLKADSGLLRLAPSSPMCMQYAFWALSKISAAMEFCSSGVFFSSFRYLYISLSTVETTIPIRLPLISILR